MSFFQHNNIRINILLQHVSTQESHRQAVCLRTVSTLYPLQYYTCNVFALGIPYALHFVSRKKSGLLFI